jgi:DNA-binding transcriptional regulator YiaG
MTPQELAGRRRALGLSRPQLARALEVSEATVYRWEEGQRGIPPLLERALRDLERERPQPTA